jgi:hypothetical protein
MKSSASIESNIERYLAQTLCGLFLLLTMWQGTLLGVNTALAAPAIAVNSSLGISNSKANIITQVANRLDREPDRIDSATKNRKDPANALLDTAETGVKINANKAEKPIDDSPEIVKKTSERNSQQAEKFSKNLTKKIKNIP